jgi:AcrR family transcriptional regulator
MQAPAGLRERKKQRTREAIVDAAFKLFAERGFEHTTIADIAAAADIAPRTFFGYFSSKEEVVFWDFQDHYDAIAARLRDRDDGETTMAALRVWIGEQFHRRELNDERNRLRRRLIAECEPVTAADRHKLGQFEDLLAESVARDLGDRPEDLRPRMVAAAATAALGSFQARVKQGGDPAVEPDEAVAMFNQAMTFLEGGIAALRED